MDYRKIIYFLLLVIIIVIFLSSISVNVSYSSNGTNNRHSSVVSQMNNAQVSNNNLPDSLYVHDMDNVNKSNTIYAKIVDRPDVSVHKQLLSSENKFYTNRCSL